MVPMLTKILHIKFDGIITRYVGNITASMVDIKVVIPY